jgi:hypothetical protein
MNGAEGRTNQIPVLQDRSGFEETGNLMSGVLQASA